MFFKILGTSHGMCYETVKDRIPIYVNREVGNTV